MLWHGGLLSIEVKSRSIDEMKINDISFILDVENTLLDYYVLLSDLNELIGL